MKTHIHIWHDPTGKIIAVGKPSQLMQGRVEPRAANSNHSVLTTEIESQSIDNLLQTHVVDISSSQLKLKGQA